MTKYAMETSNVCAVLLRYDWNKILSIKRHFMYINKDKNGREDFEVLNFDTESEC